MEMMLIYPWEMIKMPTFSKLTPRSEAELHSIIGNELDALEEGLTVLKHEFAYGKGIVDFLCVDSGGRLAIVEVKLSEDENVLFQALRYYADIDRDKYLIATSFPKASIDPQQSPRVVLIAERFSEDLRRLSTLVVPEVELFEYMVLLTPSGEKGIVYRSVSLPTVHEPPAKPPTIADLENYLKNAELKPILEQMREAIKKVGPRMDEYATQSYIGYRHPSGRQFAYIRVYRQSLELGSHIIDEDKQLLSYEGVRVESGAEELSEILAKIKQSYENLNN